ncbi:MAG: RNA polymerase sigma factor [Saprospiraceae bacterium]|nr:RNA polymerase sigma factor [Saprospiraceae bacterium]
MAQLTVYQQFNALTNTLNAFAMSLTNDKEEAKDLFQETAYRTFKNKDKYRKGTNFRAWVMTIMKNIFINNYRKKSRRSTIMDSTDDNYYINSGGETVENGALSEITNKELVGMVDSLEDHLREPFLMAFRGYKYKEIAEHFDLPLGTVKSRIFFARKYLKEMIEERYESEEVILG